MSLARRVVYNTAQQAEFLCFDISAFQIMHAPAGEHTRYGRTSEGYERSRHRVCTYK